MKTISHEEFLKLKSKAIQQQTKLPEAQPLEEGEKYFLNNFDLIIVKKIDTKRDLIQIFNFTQQCNTHSRLSTFRYKSLA